MYFQIFETSQIWIEQSCKAENTFFVLFFKQKIYSAWFHFYNTKIVKGHQRSVPSIGERSRDGLATSKYLSRTYFSL